VLAAGAGNKRETPLLRQGVAEQMAERLLANVNHYLWCKADLFGTKPNLFVTKDI
jgi:hypothetical protein